MSPQTLSRVAYRHNLGKIREATEKDKGPFMVLHTCYFDNGNQYTWIVRSLSDNTILRYETLEEAQKSTYDEVVEDNEVRACLLFKPTFTIIVSI